MTKMPQWIGLLFCLGCSRGADAPQTTPPTTATGDSTTETATTVPPTPANMIIVIGDDIGIDVLAAYNVQPHHSPPTPAIDALIDRGVLFRNAYAYPSCSSARAAILTGRYGRRTGVGRRISLTEDAYAMPLEEVTLPEMLAQSPFPWDSSMTGKWHMANFSYTGWQTNASDQGFNWHAGSPGNVNLASYGGLHTYFEWEKIDNGASAPHIVYATSDTINDAVDRAATMEEPWLLYLAFNAPHHPFHIPPDDLWNVDDVPSAAVPSAAAGYRAMLQSLDTELSRLFDSIPQDVMDRTNIVFLGDNGTPGAAVIPPLLSDHAKSSMFEGGTHVPMIIAGPAVTQPGSESDALVSVVDIFPTLAELALVDLTTVLGADGQPVDLDGISMVPYLADPQTLSQREYLYTERFGPNGAGPYTATDESALRDGRWKVLRNNRTGVVRLHDLVPEFPDDGPDVLEDGISTEEQLALDRLVLELDARLDDMTFGP